MRELLVDFLEWAQIEGTSAEDFADKYLAYRAEKEGDRKGRDVMARHYSGETKYFPSIRKAAEFAGFANESGMWHLLNRENNRKNGWTYTYLYR